MVTMYLHLREWLSLCIQMVPNFPLGPKFLPIPRLVSELLHPLFLDIQWRVSFSWEFRMLPRSMATSCRPSATRSQPCRSCRYRASNSADLHYSEPNPAVIYRRLQESSLQWLHSRAQNILQELHKGRVAQHFQERPMSFQTHFTGAVRQRA